MSIEAIKWALNDAPEVPASLVSTLLGLANHAGPDGRNAYPKLATLARYTRKSERSVMWDLNHLLALGLIREGAETVVEHIPGGHRPGVYHLAMERRRDPTKPEKAAARPARPKPKKKTSPVADDTSPTPVVDDRSLEPSPVVDDRSSPELHDRSSPVVDDKPDLSSTTSALIRNEPVTREPSSEPSVEPSTAGASPKRRATIREPKPGDGMLPMPVAVPSPRRTNRQPNAKRRPSEPDTRPAALAGAADELVDAYADALTHPLGRRTRRQLLDLVDELLVDGFTAEQIRDGLRLLWKNRDRYGPGMLPTFVQQAIAAVSMPANVRPFRGRKETNMEILDRIEAQMNASTSPDFDTAGFGAFASDRVVDSFVIHPGATA